MSQDNPLRALECAVKAAIENLDLAEKVLALNSFRAMLQSVSPFHQEPVDFVQWVDADKVVSNEYNPNSVAPPEMRLLEHSIIEDGYTQPIVAFKRDDTYEVVDGFHRNRVGKESLMVRSRIKGYLPLVVINQSRSDTGDRMASTIRHNRARGKHRIDAMAEIVLDLRRRNWSNEKIGRDLGMDPDEVLRLSQITGLAEMFSNREFSQAWEADSVDEDDDLVDVVEETQELLS